jgi:hypothetical protein
MTWRLGGVIFFFVIIIEGVAPHTCRDILSAIGVAGTWETFTFLNDFTPFGDEC